MNSSAGHSAYDHALVAGGTGMLRGATIAIASESRVVSLLARGADRFAASRPGSWHPMAVDWRATADVTAHLARATARHGQPDLAVVWIHEAGKAAILAIADAMAGHSSTFVHVVGSASGDPRAAHADVADYVESLPGVTGARVVLGHHRTPNGGRRWLTDAEISDGVLAAIHRLRSRVATGTARPSGPAAPATTVYIVGEVGDA